MCLKISFLEKTVVRSYIYDFLQANHFTLYINTYLLYLNLGMMNTNERMTNNGFVRNMDTRLTLHKRSLQLKLNSWRIQIDICLYFLPFSILFSTNTSEQLTTSIFLHSAQVLTLFSLSNC